MKTLSMLLAIYLLGCVKSLDTSTDSDTDIDESEIPSNETDCDSKNDSALILFEQSLRRQVFTDPKVVPSNCTKCALKKVVTVIRVETLNETYTTSNTTEEVLQTLIVTFKSMTIVCDCEFKTKKKTVQGKIYYTLNDTDIEFIIGVRCGDSDYEKIVTLVSADVKSSLSTISLKVDCQGDKQYKSICTKAYHSKNITDVFKTVEFDAKKDSNLLIYLNCISCNDND